MGLLENLPPRSGRCTYWAAITAIVVALAIQQDRPVTTIAAHDIARFVDGHLYCCSEGSLSDAGC